MANPMTPPTAECVVETGISKNVAAISHAPGGEDTSDEMSHSLQDVLIFIVIHELSGNWVLQRDRCEEKRHRSSPVATTTQSIPYMKSSGS